MNVAGSFILGFLSGWLLHGAEPSSVRALVAVGFCGGLTTFSTFGYETVRLFLEKTRLYAVLNVVVTVLAGLASGALGLLLGDRRFHVKRSGRRDAAARGRAPRRAAPPDRFPGAARRSSFPSTYSAKRTSAP